MALFMFYSELIGLNLPSEAHLQQRISNSAQGQYDNTAWTVLTFPRRRATHDMACQPWIMAEEYSPGAQHPFQN